MDFLVHKQKHVYTNGFRTQTNTMYILILARVRYYTMFVTTLCSLLRYVRYYAMFVTTLCSLLRYVRYYTVFVTTLCYGSMYS